MKGQNQTKQKTEQQMIDTPDVKQMQQSLINYYTPQPTGLPFLAEQTPFKDMF